jgi:hypothetical protein
MQPSRGDLSQKEQRWANSSSLSMELVPHQGAACARMLLPVMKSAKTARWESKRLSDAQRTKTHVRTLGLFLGLK